jgi:DNA repair photolyase
MLDLEEFAEHTLRMMIARPQQKLYRYDMYGDSICFEPEYGASAVLSETFARAGGGRRLLFYTKSDNVDHLLDLPHKSSCIFYLSLAPRTVCREIEPGTPGMEARIEALRKCERAGYPVRVGFSPIVPTPHWRREATECIEALFAAVRPQTVRLWVLSLMRPDAALAMFEPDRLDERYLQAIRDRRDFTPEEIFDQPFPHWARAEIYGHYLDEIHRVSPRTPVSLCSERRELWEMLAPKLAISPDALYCCCGGVSP